MIEAFATGRSMTNWVERLTGETRAQLLRLLRRSRQTITALADAVGLTDNAVRTHVAALERDGLVEPVGTQRDTGGKPARVYALTGEGEELFPKAYALVLGESLLGVDWILGPSDRFAKYAFNVVVARILTPMERKHLRAIVEYLKPAHTHFVDLVEPFPPIVPDHWELGQSDLAVSSFLH